ncbi:type I restriction-modification system subunit M N-terminal domain-containing protein [Caldifermentibacillus hisashii]
METAKIGFEETLWKSADKLRGSMDASEYKHVVLGLIFLRASAKIKNIPLSEALEN